jgi:hypothetical protein
LVALVVFASGLASAKKRVAEPTYSITEAARDTNQVFWFDDVESGSEGWVTEDWSATATPHFHIDTYLAYEGLYSWWCGTLDYDADGGYGNSWDDRLNLPPVDIGGATYPILTYAFRHDSEIGYDFTYVQAESNGVFVDLNRGYDDFQPWTDIGTYGFILVAHDNPVVARFRFVSDGAWSDEDGLYLTNGGAFHCDIIKIFDYFTGYVYFFDDVESGGLCVPGVPPASGDYWHIIDRACPALSDPHCWWCGDDADTSFVPANLQNALYSPVIDASEALSCTVRFAQHFAIPTVDNDYLSYYATCDGTNYYSIGGWWGDFGSCDGWGGTAYNIGFDAGQFCGGREITAVGFLWIMYTTDNGCGPAAGGDAGGMIDDITFLRSPPSPVENMSWTKVKALYR